MEIVCFSLADSVTSIIRYPSSQLARLPRQRLRVRYSSAKSEVLVLISSWLQNSHKKNAIICVEKNSLLRIWDLPYQILSGGVVLFVEVWPLFVVSEESVGLFSWLFTCCNSSEGFNKFTESAYME